MAIYSVTLQRLMQWSDINEYEGLVEVRYQEKTFVCYTYTSSPTEWQELRVGVQYNVELVVDRWGDITIIDPSTPPLFQQVYNHDSLYTLVGSVESRTHEELVVKSDLLLIVDLCIPVTNPDLGKNIKIGDTIQLQGILRLDFDPDDDDDYPLPWEQIK